MKSLERYLGAKRDEIIREWRTLHNAALHAEYSLSNMTKNIKSRRLRWAGHVSRMEQYRNAYRVLVGKPEGKRPLGRPRRRCEDNIKMDLNEMGCGASNLMDLAENRALMNIRLPYKSVSFLDLSFLQRTALHREMKQ